MLHLSHGEPLLGMSGLQGWQLPQHGTPEQLSPEDFDGVQDGGIVAGMHTGRGRGAAGLFWAILRAISRWGHVHVAAAQKPWQTRTWHVPQTKGATALTLDLESVRTVIAGGARLTRKSISFRGPAEPVRRDWPVASRTWCRLADSLRAGPNLTQALPTSAWGVF